MSLYLVEFQYTLDPKRNRVHRQQIQAKGLSIPDAIANAVTEYEACLSPKLDYSRSRLRVLAVWQLVEEYPDGLPCPR